MTDQHLSRGRIRIRRHSLFVRATHAATAACVLILMASGLQILNAHPAFYIGEASRFDRPVLAAESVPGRDGSPRSRLVVGGAAIDASGVLGATPSADGRLAAGAVPSVLTLPGTPDLGAGRRWHFFFAWSLILIGALALSVSAASGRLRRDLLPGRRHLIALRRDVVDHIKLAFPKGEAARSYGPLQRLTYALVLFLLLPLMVLTGFAMSPMIDARVPFLTALFGGRQTARLLHFAGFSALAGFLAIHLAMIAAAGPFNLLRSMITGGYVIRSEGSKS